MPEPKETKGSTPDSDPVRRLNHWVPKSYLAPFTHTGRVDGLLTAYRRGENGRFRELPPDYLAKERDLYVVRRQSGELDDAVERMLADHIEGPFVPVRDRLVYGTKVGLSDTLTNEQEEALAYFLAFQSTRTPQFRERINLMVRFTGTFMVRAQLEDEDGARERMEKALGRQVEIKEVREFRRDLENGDLFLDADDKYWLQHALKLALDVAPVIRDLPRRVLRAPAGIRLPTNDNPVVVVRRGSESVFVHGGGLLQPHVEITIALSPTVVLVLGGALNVFHDQGSAVWFEQVRRRIASGADQWLFASAPDPAAAVIFGRTSPPRSVVEYPGGMVGTKDSTFDAVRHMMETNPGEAILRFGPEE